MRMGLESPQAVDAKITGDGHTHGRNVLFPVDPVSDKPNDVKECNKKEVGEAGQQNDRRKTFPVCRYLGDRRTKEQKPEKHFP